MEGGRGYWSVGGVGVGQLHFKICVPAHGRVECLDGRGAVRKEANSSARDAQVGHAVVRGEQLRESSEFGRE